MQIVNDNPWLALATPRDASALSARRVSEINRWDFYWARDGVGNFLLVLNHDHASSSHGRLPHLKGIEVSIQEASEPSKLSLAIRLLDSSLRDLFHRLCLDIIESTAGASSENEAVETALARTWRWHHMLRGGGSGLLSPEEQKGLIGELLVLERYFLPVLSPGVATSAWRGPLGEPKDFVVGRTAIESKARSTASAAAVHISSEYQLDDSDTDRLFLHLAVIDPCPADEVGGFTVTEVACRVRDYLRTTDERTVEHFNALLMAAGFRYVDDYSPTRWKGGERGIYRVTGDFPRLVPATLPAGVENVRYMLSLGPCGSFLVNPVMLTAALQGEGSVSSGH